VSVDLTHRFTVPTGVEETWAHFNDIASVAECFPGATVTSVEDDTFAGTVKVKLGPIALVYAGSGTFVEKDEGAHRFVVEAKGRDKRGNGTAGATVTLTMADAPGGTDVEVVTDLSITGKPAQFGRGVMQDVSDKLLGQFVSCLEQRLAADEAPPAVVPDEIGVIQPDSPRDRQGVSAPAAGGPAEVAAASAVVPDEVGPPGAPEGPDRQGVPPASTVSSAPKHAAGPVADDALDLGAAVLPVLARTYWKQGLGAVGVLAFLWWWLSGRD
jgi:carbon monoxide dehydrogenase subunit G